MNNPNPAYYSILTADVRYSKELSDFEKLLFSEISALTQKDGYCTASNAWLASLYGKTKETISRCISKLKKLGFIEVVEVRNDKKEVILRKVYLLTKTSTGIDENAETLLTKTSIPIDKNVKENNTRINNTSRNNTSIKRDASKTHETDLQILQDMGVEKQLAQDWLQTRKEKRAGSLTPTVVAGLQREAAKAGLTVPQAVQVAAERGWGRFVASYLQNEQQGFSGSQKPQGNRITRTHKHGEEAKSGLARDVLKGIL
ncbi:helix-turn-helix domain-containing protein [Kingella negevensis]|uniref:Helix-turn-helix domain-containing protein n=1 Tax=Kingella negevensis TaxID=1522312 RepID=A0A238TDY4_9NEIS|nr:helix-turn-helix domain-containing protein [Kingella negevensis]MDK4680151.1 helix-turn-helix domain-containing protein [Kingella negevensis]MDK4682129.1 helix-turn-helix domain-containing protein [Kingella negevensis]MDK4685570.1 helix-turn-helix domain-containing protein [Kingella negevensis]MDK4690325.1 helix-turn-helix domain-containing protein [Kingella negevensis]MDK4692328.1 helix-turn-helix domain-containing protein [Kingella negevensis]